MTKKPTLAWMQAQRNRARDEGNRLEEEAWDLLIGIHLGMPLSPYIEAVTKEAVRRFQLVHSSNGTHTTLEAFSFDALKVVTAERIEWGKRKAERLKQDKLENKE